MATMSKYGNACADWDRFYSFTVTLMCAIRPGNVQPEVEAPANVAQTLADSLI